jgi:hypothetical protein
LQIDPGTSSSLQWKRERIERSLNFSFHPTPGKKRITVQSLTNNGQVITCSGCRVHNDLDFISVAPLRLKVIGVRFTYPYQGSLWTSEPRDRDYELLKSWLMRAFPVAMVEFDHVASESLSPWPAGGLECVDVNAMLAEIRDDDMQQGADPRTHYYGMVYNVSGYFMRGCSSGTPTLPDASVVASGPTGDYRYPWDHDGSYGDWYGGHELSHTLGRPHVGACGAYPKDNNYPYKDYKDGGFISGSDGATAGLDVGDPTHSLHAAALPGTEWTDVMSYCDNEWLSTYTYRALLERLRAEDAQNGGIEQAWAVGSQNEPGGREGEPGHRDVMRGQFLRVIARVNLTQGTAKFVSVKTTDVRAEPLSPKKSDAQIRFLNDSGTPLQETHVVLLESTDVPYGEDRTALINAVIPKANAIGGRLQLIYRGAILDERRVTRASPRVTKVQVTWSGKGPASVATVAWDATDADVGTIDELRYTVQVSVDGGRYNTIAVGLATKSLALDRTKLSDAKAVRALVIANDGFNTGRGESKPSMVPH